MFKFCNDCRATECETLSLSYCAPAIVAGPASVITCLSSDIVVFSKMAQLQLISFRTAVGSPGDS